MELYIQNRWNNKDDAPRLKKKHRFRALPT